MEYVQRLVEIPTLKKYKIDIYIENVQGTSMLFFIAVAIVCIPLNPGGSSIYCVHHCIANSSEEFDGKNFETYYSQMCEKLCSEVFKPSKPCKEFCEYYLREYNAEICHERYCLTDDYMRDKASQFANSLCPKSELERQTTHFGRILTSLVCFTIIQSLWVTLLENELQGLLHIKRHLDKKGICRSCIKSFVLDNITGECDSCSPRGDVDSIYRPLQNDQQNLRKIKVVFANQMIANIVLVFILLAYIYINSEFPHDFDCEIPSDFAQNVQQYMYLSVMHCVNPDETLLSAVSNLMIFICGALLGLFVCRLGRREVLLEELVMGIQI